MKKIYTLLAAVLFVTSVSAQVQSSQRHTIVEHATNASCGPCASQNPFFQQVADQNTDIFTPLRLQWDFPGYDPMNEHNPSEVQSTFLLRH